MSIWRCVSEGRRGFVLILGVVVVTGCSDITRLPDTQLEAPSLCGRGHLRILPLGDSFVAGYDVRGRDFGGTTGAFRTLLWKKMQRLTPDVELVGGRLDGPDVYPDVARRHQGLPGWTISALVDGGGPTLTPPVTGDLSSWVTEAAPDVVLMIPGPEDLWGLNEGRKSYGEWVADSEATRLINAVANVAPEAYIVVGNHPPVGLSGVADNEGWLQLVRWYNSELVNVSVASYNSGSGRVKFIDLFSLLDRAQDVASDGGHPNAGGYERIAWGFVNELEPLLDCAE